MVERVVKHIDGVEYSASISDCGRYRDWLSRKWDDGPCLYWVMLNPSVADACQDDPTVRRCVGYAQRDGFGRIEVRNLYTRIGTDPRKLRELPADQIIGPAGDLALDTLAATLKPGDKIVAAWGAASEMLVRGRAKRVHAIFAQTPLYCLGVTASGAPKHPLYLKKDAPLMAFNAAAWALEATPDPETSDGQ